MSIYSDISKRIGWTGTEAIIPTIGVAKLYKQQVESGDVNSFKEVFRIHRFGSPKNEWQIESMNIIHEAFKIGSSNPEWRK